MAIKFDPVEDWDLADALFLHRHPGWTWQALQDAPDAVVEILSDLDQFAAERAAR